MAGRLTSERKAPEIVRYVMAPFLEDLGEYFGFHLEIHQAHVVMLAETGLLTRREAAAILCALQELGTLGPSALEQTMDTDLYMLMERFVTGRTPECGGKMHLGRSRNDLYACAARMRTRLRLLGLWADVLELQDTVLRRAAEHVDTVMPGYTHLQHAEPITFGHFLVAFFDALGRDVTRLRNAFDNTNLNPLGAAALAGTSFPIERKRTSELLGFRGLVENSYDAVASRDFLVESVSAVAILASNITRVVDNFIIWSTSEFSMIDLPDEYGYTSSIMPQKRNPGYFLESVRSKSARITGDLVGALCTLKGTPFAQSRDTSYEITVPVFGAFNEVTGVVNVMRGIIDAVIANREIMRKKCAEEFSGTTEIANALVREKGLAFRTAYEIVATVVRRAVERGKPPVEVSTEVIDEAAREVIGRAVGLSEGQVRAAMDPARNVELKQSIGGPSAKEVERMVRERELELHAEREALQTGTASIESARVVLAAEAAALAANA